ncbi:hypothetical protein AGMMS49975_03690 [Clostridia bacterium]|nr:hypothetical protein AGMMS49975_03690 [Clostridia bacterium]
MNHFYMNIAECLDKIFEVYKKTFKYQLLRILLVGAGGGIIAYVLVLVSVLLVAALAAFSPALGIGVGIIVGLIALSGVIYIFALNTSANLYMCKQSFGGRSPKFNQTVKFAWQNAPRVFTAYIAVGISYIPAILVMTFFILMYFNVFYASAVFEDILDYFLSGLMGYEDIGETRNFSGALYFVLFGILASGAALVVTSSFVHCSIPSAAYEKKKFFGAVSRSFSLTKGSRPRIAGIILLWLIENYTVTMTLSILTAAIVGYTQFAQNGLMSGAPALYTTLIVIAQYAVSMLSTIIMEPFRGIILSVVYFNQLTKKEGYDIVLSLEGLYYERASKPKI